MAPKKKAQSKPEAHAKPQAEAPAKPLVEGEANGAGDATASSKADGGNSGGSGIGLNTVLIAVICFLVAYIYQSGAMPSAFATKKPTKPAPQLQYKPGSRLSEVQLEKNGVHPKHHLRAPMPHTGPGAGDPTAPPQWALSEMFAGWLTAYGTGDCLTYVSYFSSDAILQDPYGNNITGYDNLLQECLTSAAYWDSMSFTWDTQYINNFGLAARTFISLQRPPAQVGNPPCLFIWEEPYLINVVYNNSSPWLPGVGGLSINYALGVSNSPLLGALCNSTQPPNCAPAARASQVIRNPNKSKGGPGSPAERTRLNSCSYGSSDLQSWQSDVAGWDVDKMIQLYESWITAFGSGDCAAYASYYTADACMNDPYGTLTCGGGGAGSNLYNRCQLSHSTWTAFSYSWDFMYVNANGLAVETQVALQKPNPTPGYAPCLFILKEMIILNVTSDYLINNIVGLYNETWLDLQCPGTPPFTSPYVTPQPYSVNYQNWLDSMYTTSDQFNAFVDAITANGGNVTTPFDEGYQYQITAAHAIPDYFPKLIVQPKKIPDDIQLTMLFAASHNMEFCVRSGGHNMLGWSTCDNGLMMNMKLMLDMEYDPASSTAKVQSGVTFGVYYDWQKELSIHTTGGSCDTVGVVGYTMGGGYGITARKFGIAADNVNSFDIVLANGTFITVSNYQYQDLFWALRGSGGGNYGIVTAVNSTMYPLLPQVTSVNATWPISMAGQVIKVWQQYYTLNGTGGLVTDDLSLYLEFSTNQPGGPGAEKIIAAIGIYWGNDTTFSAVNRMMQPLLAIPGLIQYQYALGTYQEINENMFATIEWAMAFTQGIPYFELKNSGYVSHMLQDYEIDKIVEIYNCCAPVGHGSEISFESYGGAIATKARDYIAFPHRNAYFNLFCDGFWQYYYEADVAQQWAKQFWATLSGTVLNGEVYVNYPMITLDDNYPEAYWAENYSRLRTVKSAYDPFNFFWLPQQIVPWESGAMTPAQEAAARQQYYAWLMSRFPGFGPIGPHQPAPGRVKKGAK